MPPMPDSTNAVIQRRLHRRGRIGGRRGACPERGRGVGAAVVNTSLGNAPRRQAFSLVELLISMAILSIMMLFLANITGTVSNTWTSSEKRVETFQSARAALEIITREMTPAVVDTRMQFSIFPGTQLETMGAKNIVPEAPVVLWMAPLGEQGDLRCVGYYLYRDDDRKFYRLKRIYIAADNQDGFFPQMSDELDPHDSRLRTSPTDALWFTRGWKSPAFDEEDPDNKKVVVSTVADGVVAFWVQCLDLLGNPIPWVSESPIHPPTNLIYNSSSYFQMATSVRFDGGETFLYLTEDTMKGNRVPAAVDITVVTIDVRTLAKGFFIPDQKNVMTPDGALDVKESIEAFNAALRENSITDARTFTTRVKLVNGS